MPKLFRKKELVEKSDSNDAAISVTNVSKYFRIPRERRTTLKENVIGMLQGKQVYDEFWALRKVSFSIKKGETLGIIGENGSGKSTLLKLIAGVLYPDEGSIKVKGRIAPFLELGVGFQGDLTAKENVYLYGSILGMTKKEMDGKFEDIMEFAELKKFENMKLKNFSSGMYARLAFATAAATKPDILLLDEVLAVGDERFQMKCKEKMLDFKKEGATIILVSHSLDAIQSLCDRAILFEHGTLNTSGNVWDVGDKYKMLMQIKQLESLEPIAPEDGKIMDDTDVLFIWKATNPPHLIDHITFAIRDITNNQIGKLRVFKLINTATEFHISKKGLKINGEIFFLEKGKKYRWSIGDKSAHPSRYKDSAGTVKIFSIKGD